MKSVDQYLGLNYRTSVHRDEEGDFIVKVPDLPGCIADGRTPNEAFDNLRQAMRAWIESRVAAGLDVPEPKAAENFSGRVLLRMPRYLHERLSQQAEGEGVSLNQYMVSLLSEASAPAQTQAAVTQASANAIGFGAGSLSGWQGVAYAVAPFAGQICLAPGLTGWPTRMLPISGSYISYNYDSFLESNVICSANVPETRKVTVAQEKRKEPTLGPQLVPKQVA